MKSRLQSVHVEQLKVTGDCGGLATLTTSLPIATTFDGQAAFVVTQNLSVPMLVSGCTLLRTDSTGLGFYDSNFNEVGAYAVATGMTEAYTTARSLGPTLFSAPMTLPTSVRVGGAGLLGVFKTFADAGMSTQAGKVALSYVVEPVSAESVDVVFTRQDYSLTEDGDGYALAFTSKTRYRLATDNTATLVNMDLFNNTNKLHVVLERY